MYCINRGTHELMKACSMYCTNRRVCVAYLYMSNLSGCSICHSTGLRRAATGLGGGVAVWRDMTYCWGGAYLHTKRPSRQCQHHSADLYTMEKQVLPQTPQRASGAQPPNHRNPIHSPCWGPRYLPPPPRKAPARVSPVGIVTNPCKSPASKSGNGATCRTPSPPPPAIQTQHGLAPPSPHTQRPTYLGSSRYSFGT